MYMWWFPQQDFGINHIHTADHIRGWQNVESWETKMDRVAERKTEGQTQKTSTDQSSFTGWEFKKSTLSHWITFICTNIICYILYSQIINSWHFHKFLIAKYMHMINRNYVHVG